MKELLTILIHLSSTFVFGQVVDTSNIKKFVIGDRIIECNDCTTDFCGNLLNASGDTIAVNNRPLNSSDKPIYLTKENVLLSSKTAKAAIDAKNVRALTVIKCNIGRQVFGDVAKNGIIIIEFIHDILSPVPLTQFIATKLNKQQNLIRTILINGMLSNDNRLKVNKGDYFEIYYDKNTDTYNVIIE